MMRFQQKFLKSGFTVIELLIVIVVIGILATLIIISYNGVEQAAKDKSILSDIDGVSAEITRYSVKHSGVFGSTVEWYSGGDQNPNLKFTASPGNVIDVRASDTEYCIRAYNPGATKKTLATAATKGSETDSCTRLSPSSLASSGTMTVPATPLATTNSTTQITLSWAATANATGYKIDYATNSGFTSPTVITNVTTTSKAISGLSPAQTYYFRIYAVNGSFVSSTSASTSAMTGLGTPSSVVATTASSSQINLTWDAVVGAGTYTVQYSTSASFTSPTTFTGIVTNSKSVTGLSSSGQIYYFRVYTVAGVNTSAASATVSAVTSLSAPSITLAKSSITGNPSNPAQFWVVNNAPSSVITYSGLGVSVTSLACAAGPATGQVGYQAIYSGGQTPGNGWHVDGGVMYGTSTMYNYTAPYTSAYGVYPGGVILKIFVYSRCTSAYVTSSTATTTFCLDGNSNVVTCF